MAMRSVRMTLAIGLVVAVAVGVTWSPPGSAIVVEGGSECRVGRGLDPTFGTRGVANASMSATEADRFLALTIAREGRARGMTYGAGFVTRSGDQAMAIARLRRNGSFDRSFSGDGIATVNVAVGGRTAELARGVVEQSTGRVVVAGPVEHDPGATGDAARDTDVAVARVNRRGRLDRRFGENGITRLDLSTGVAASPTSFIGDTSWGLTRLRNDRLLVVAAKRAEGRTDRDFAVVKLTANGRRDRSFGTDGVVTVDVGHGDESPKQAVVQPDGKIVMSGYTSSGASSAPCSSASTRTAGSTDPSARTASRTSGCCRRSPRPTTSPCKEGSSSSRATGAATPPSPSTSSRRASTPTARWTGPSAPTGS